jgi:hypothetical protein
LKATPKPRGKKAQTQVVAPTSPEPADDDLPDGMEDFIKSEKRWEDDLGV